MATPRSFAQVDVFTAIALLGNPVAVVLDGSGLDDTAMQRFANWTNLSETTFVLPASDPAADYHLKIFTPKTELPFAGHPTLGSAHALLESGFVAARDGRLVQQCGVGLVEIAVSEDWRTAGLSFRLPPHKIAAAPEPASLIAALGATPNDAPMIVDVGPRWVIAEFANASDVLEMCPNLAALADYDRRHATTGQTVFADDGVGGIVVRSFAPTDEIAEDPVCGSGNGAVAAYRLEQAVVSVGDSYSASQGTVIGRDGIIDVRYGTDGIHIGGRCVTVIQGQCLL